MRKKQCTLLAMHTARPSNLFLAIEQYSARKNKQIKNKINRNYTPTILITELQSRRRGFRARRLKQSVLNVWRA